jgi:hypothetical protein
MKQANEFERVHPGASAGAVLVKEMSQGEQVDMHGKYHFSCMGPKEHERNAYVELRCRMELAEEAGDYTEAARLFAELQMFELEEKWQDDVNNLVTTAGKNDLLDKYLAGSAYTAAWYLLLVDGGSAPTYAAGDTSASHAGWTENAGYSNATRPAPSWGAAAAGSKASTATAFNINATGTIAGAGLISNSTKSGTTGVLYSCGSFSGGNRSVVNGDTLNVTYTASA